MEQIAVAFRLRVVAEDVIALDVCTYVLCSFCMLMCVCVCVCVCVSFARPFSSFFLDVVIVVEVAYMYARFGDCEVVRELCIMAFALFSTSLQCFQLFRLFTSLSTWQQ